MKNRVFVWSAWVRWFHWLLVAAFTTSYLTGEEETIVHIYSGYLIVALLIFRIVAGFVSGGHARFSRFVRSPLAAFAYLKGLVSGNVKHYPGHNPAGGWMVILLLVSLLGTTVTGLNVYGYEGGGPLAGWLSGSAGETAQVATQRRTAHEDEHDDEYGSEVSGDREEEAEEVWEEVHETFANTTLVLVFLHILGVVASSIRGRENLVRSMITGYKRQQSSDS